MRRYLAVAGMDSAGWHVSAAWEPADVDES